MNLSAFIFNWSDPGSEKARKESISFFQPLERRWSRRRLECMLSYSTNYYGQKWESLAQMEDFFCLLFCGMSANPL